MTSRFPTVCVTGSRNPSAGATQPRPRRANSGQMRAARAPSGGPGDSGDRARDGACRVHVADVAVEYEERYWYPDSGAVIWVAGHAVVDPESGRYLARDAPQLAARGLVVCGVAGSAAFHDDVLQSDGVLPGVPLMLRRDPGNEHDANAVAVH